MTGPDVPVLCPGGTVVCLATGPSLTPADVETCRGRATVIAINDAHRMAPWADVLYSSDQRWWAYHGGVPAFQGRKFGLDPLKPPPAWGITVLRNSGEAGLDVAAGAIRNGRNSGYAAINLAVQFGAARILLLGYDMAATRGRPSHCFGEHPERLRSASPFPVFLAMYQTLVGPLAQIGVTVLNCSRQSALEMFPRGSLTEALA